MFRVSAILSLTLIYGELQENIETFVGGILGIFSNVQSKRYSCHTLICGEH